MRWTRNPNRSTCPAWCAGNCPLSPRIGAAARPFLITWRGTTCRASPAWTRALWSGISARRRGPARRHLAGRDGRQRRRAGRTGAAGPSMAGCDLASVVTDPHSYVWQTQPLNLPAITKADDAHRLYLDYEEQYGRIDQAIYAGDYGGAGEPLVVAYGFGIKRNILRLLRAQGMRVRVVPAQTSAADVLAMNPAGVFLSNGPGDPEPVDYAIRNIRELMGRRPIFAICLGHQLLALAAGARTYKLKFGHRGANQPVKDLTTGRVWITSQNHGFCVDRDSLAGSGLEVTQINLNDQTVEALADEKRRILTVQYHPEASPGPHDTAELFRRFRERL
ncbi:carbamoyl phosphate synthase small subunit [bacterium]|nr:carbamoyl phosphate synthase small subunit [bacterium]